MKLPAPTAFEKLFAAMLHRSIYSNYGLPPGHFVLDIEPFLRTIRRLGIV